MKKYIVVGLLAVLFIISPVFVSAQSTSVLSSTQLQIQQLRQQLISSLLALIAQLKQQLAVLQSQQSQFTATSPLMVFSPNGGERWQFGSTRQIGFNWQTNTFSGQPFNIYLLRGTQRLIIASGISGTSYYDWNVGDVTTGGVITSFGNNFLVEVCGQSNFGGVICDRSNNYFEIYSSSTQQPITTRNVKVGMDLADVTVIIHPTNQPNSIYTLNLTTSSDGTLLVPLQVGQSYTFNLSKQGYLNQSFVRTIPDGLGTYIIMFLLGPPTTLDVFPDKLSSCTKYKNTIINSSIGEIFGIINGRCSYIEKSNNIKMECKFTESARIAVAQYYRNIVTAESFGINVDPNIVRNEQQKTTYIMDGKEVENPLREALNNGMCVISGY